MQIELSEEQRLLQEMVQRFAEEVVAPRAAEIDESGLFPRDFFDQAAELGLGGVAVSEEYGGAGMDTISYCVAIEEIARVSESVEEVNSYTTTISDAVQQQGSATSEISRNVAEAADGTRSVATTVVSLNQGVAENSAAVGDMLQATIEMKQQAEHLRASVEKFLSEVAAA